MATSGQYSTGLLHLDGADFVSYHKEERGERLSLLLGAGDRDEFHFHQR